MGDLGEVGTTRIFENDKIIMWEFVLEPGAETPLHEHRHDYVFYVLDGAPLEVSTPTARISAPSRRPPGRSSRFDSRAVTWYRPTKTATACRRCTRRRNAGETRYREILVESK